MRDLPVFSDYQLGFQQPRQLDWLAIRIQHLLMIPIGHDQHSIFIQHELPDARELGFAVVIHAKKTLAN